MDSRLELDFKFLPDFQIDNDTSGAINKLLTLCFPDENYHGRDYFKQLPHHRLLAYEANRLVGQLGIDFRAMNLNGQPVHVFGVIDLCVTPSRQGQGIGRMLLERVESIASDSERIDFLFLVADQPALYEKLGYKTTDLETTWLKIDEFQNYGVGTERITDTHFLYKAVSHKQWNNGELDLLGHMY